MNFVGKLAFLVLFISFAFYSYAVAKACKDSDECDDGQCCVGFTPFRGTCQLLTKEGRKCLVDERVFPFNEIYIVSCPCEEGLECVGKIKVGEVENDGTCQVPPKEGTTEAEE